MHGLLTDQGESCLPRIHHPCRFGPLQINASRLWGFAGCASLRPGALLGDVAFGTVKCLSSVLYFASQQLRHSFNPSSGLGICLGRFYYILQRQPCRRVRVSNGVASCLSGPRSRQLLGFRLHVNKAQQSRECYARSDALVTVLVIYPSIR